MALRLQGSNVYAQVTGLTTNWDYVGASLLMWVKREAANSTVDSCALSLHSSSDTICTEIRTSGADWKASDSGGNLSSAMAAYANDTWQCLGFGIENSTGNRFVFGGNASAMTRTSTGLGVTRGATVLSKITLGQNMGLSEAFYQYGGRIAHVRHYNVLLTQAQSLTEAQNATTQMGANCIYAWPLISDGNPAVGSGSFSITGTGGSYDAESPYSSSSAIAALSSYYSNLRSD